MLTDRLTERQTDWQTDKPTDRPTNRPTDRQTDGRTLSYIEMVSQLKPETCGIFIKYATVYIIYKLWVNKNKTKNAPHGARGVSTIVFLRYILCWVHIKRFHTINKLKKIESGCLITDGADYIKFRVNHFCGSDLRAIWCKKGVGGFPKSLQRYQGIIFDGI